MLQTLAAKADRRERNGTRKTWQPKKKEDVDFVVGIEDFFEEDRENFLDKLKSHRRRWLVHTISFLPKLNSKGLNEQKKAGTHTQYTYSQKRKLA